jgi:hypothetical protein
VDAVWGPEVFGTKRLRERRISSLAMEKVRRERRKSGLAVV